MDRLNTLTTLYRDYLDQYAQRLEEAGPFRGLQKFLLGSSTAGDRKADTAFYHGVEEAVVALSAAADDVVIRAVRYMALEAEGMDPSSILMMEAAQGLAAPLAARLPREEAASILSEYKARYPKKRMMVPRQRELLAALEQAAT